MLRLLPLALLAGCTETGVLLTVHGDGQPGSIATLELFAAPQSYCDRWVRDSSATETTYSVAGRNLDKSPYKILVKPPHVVDLSQPVYYVVVAFDGQGLLTGSAEFGDQAFEANKVFGRDASIDDLLRPQPTSGPGPQYFGGSDEDCLCLPGRRWIGNGRRTSCDLRVVPSQDRVADTAGCDLPPQIDTLLKTPVCDGQTWSAPGDQPMRTTACFVTDKQGACKMVARQCADQNGVAWGEECNPDDASAQTLPSTALCDAFAACEATPCNDLDGCFLRTAPTQTVACTLSVDPATGMPCAGKNWTAALGAQTTAACTTAVIADPPPVVADVKNTATTGCAPVLEVTSVGDVGSAPASTEIDAVVGDKVLKIGIHLVKSCAVDAPGLVCQ
jgi:hypothetical protein